MKLLFGFLQIDKDKMEKNNIKSMRILLVFTILLLFISFINSGITTTPKADTSETVNSIGSVGTLLEQSTDIGVLMGLDEGQIVGQGVEYYKSPDTKNTQLTFSKADAEVNVNGNKFANILPQDTAKHPSFIELDKRWKSFKGGFPPLVHMPCSASSMFQHSNSSRSPLGSFFSGRVVGPSSFGASSASEISRRGKLGKENIFKMTILGNVMSPSIRGPPGKKLLPSRYPELELPNQWRTRFDELIATGIYNQDQALRTISRESGGASISTIYLSIHPSKKVEYSRALYKSWHHEKSRSTFSREHFNQHRALRDHVRRHLDDYLPEVFERLGRDQAHLLSDLSDAIKAATGVYLRPPTLLKISNEFEQRYQQPLLVRATGVESTVYYSATVRLSETV